MANLGTPHASLVQTSTPGGLAHNVTTGVAGVASTTLTPSSSTPGMSLASPHLPMQTSSAIITAANTHPRPAITAITKTEPGVTSMAAIPNAMTPTTSATPGAAGARGVPTQGTYPVAGQEAKVLDKRRLADLVKEIDPLEQLDEEVEEMLMQIADDFIDNVVTSSCQIAKHRKAGTVDVKDVQLHLERNWNMWIPGFGSEDMKPPYKKAATTEAHKQRMALIKKSLKKY